MIFSGLLPSELVETSVGAALAPDGRKKFTLILLVSGSSPREFLFTVPFTISVRHPPAAVACVPVIVIPVRTPVRTAYSSVLLAKTAQQISISTRIIASIGRKTNVNSSTSAPLRRCARHRRLVFLAGSVFFMDDLWFPFLPPEHVSPGKADSHAEPEFRSAAMRIQLRIWIA